jgi:LysR family transcriptional regulator, glycine cleavage system transcriptional activator
MRLPPLTALRSFEAAARHESFTLAARELCVTTGAVSRQVRLLETHLGVQLFTRHHRKVLLTLAGRRYLDVVARMFAEIADAGETLAHDAHGALVRIDCVPTLAMHWLMPRVAAFHDAFPGIRIDVTTGTGPLDVSAPFDLAIRRDPRHFSGLPGEPFMTEFCAPVCDPAFAQRHDLANVDTMLGAPTIRIRSRDDLWPTWTRTFGLKAPSASKRLVVDHTFAALQAAEDGLGTAVVPLLLARKHLESGRLVVLFAALLAESGTYALLSRSASEPEAARHVRAWLIGQGRVTEQA